MSSERISGWSSPPSHLRTKRYPCFRIRILRNRVRVVGLWNNRRRIFRAYKRSRVRSQAKFVRQSTRSLPQSGNRLLPNRATRGHLFLRSHSSSRPQERTPRKSSLRKRRSPRISATRVRERKRLVTQTRIPTSRMPQRDCVLGSHGRRVFVFDPQRNTQLCFARCGRSTSLHKPKRTQRSASSMGRVRRIGASRVGLRSLRSATVEGSANSASSKMRGSSDGCEIVRSGAYEPARIANSLSSATN